VKQRTARRSRPVRHEVEVKVRGRVFHRPSHRGFCGMPVHAAGTGCGVGLRCCAQDLVLRCIFGQLAL
jgi:hypothetical protein